ncbi:citrate synthase [Colletotrichum abscissum]|uniref:Citrate synthase n=1 Tax=Colletotrichum abscissum TaxID=1671311 RepID=A0A9P9XG32_9PEZI|nr:citrate synthase [Colletotrichum abscissum]KAI3551777.1 citrate synthase [Colletotrichum abscissum]KAK1471945.1 citrate synthase [Colletotrichum abscissum]
MDTNYTTQAVVQSKDNSMNTAKDFRKSIKRTSTQESLTIKKILKSDEAQKLHPGYLRLRNSFWSTTYNIGAATASYVTQPFSKLGQTLMLPTQLARSLLFGTKADPSSGTLTICDNRTQRRYEIPINRNAIKALELQKIISVQADVNSVSYCGLKILDPGYLNTACVESNITYIDGGHGSIHYRGYSIEYLFENHDYEEVVFLLIWGHLPDANEKNTFRRKIAAGCIPPPHVVEVIESFPRDSLTSTMVFAGMAAYASHDEGAIATLQSGRPAFMGQADKVDEALIGCISALATVVALVYCRKRNKTFTPADPDESFIANMLRMMGFHEDKHSNKPNQEIVKCFEKLWILYADHEMTNSTAAFLHAASTLTDPLACCISGLVSGYGPLHGGAIELAYKAFEDLKTPENVPLLIADVKAKKQRLFGYGHRIYKAVDPRAKFIRAMIDQYKDKVESNPLLSIAMEIDRVANADKYFTSRNLKANADLYGCFLYTAFGFETDIILAMASLSRMPGVLAHWREAMLEKGPMLWRPQQVFTGPPPREGNSN